MPGGCGADSHSRANARSYPNADANPHTNTNADADADAIPDADADADANTDATSYLALGSPRRITSAGRKCNRERATPRRSGRVRSNARHRQQLRRERGHSHSGV